MVWRLVVLPFLVQVVAEGNPIDWNERAVVRKTLHIGRMVSNETDRRLV